MTVPDAGGLHRRALLQRAFVLGVGGPVLAGALARAAAAAPLAVAPTKPRTRVIVVQPGAISSLEPDGPAFVNAFQAVTNCYDGLTDVAMPADLDAAARQLRSRGLPALPALAESWEANAKRTVWRFHLRQGVQSARGNTMSADDVLWSAQKWLGQKFIASLLLGLGNIADPAQLAAPDPATVQLTLTAAAPPWFLALFALGFLPVYDCKEARKRVTAADPFAQNFTRAATPGFGPYTLQTLSPSGDQALLVANPRYWRGVPRVRSIVRQAVDDDGQRLQLLLARTADYADQLTALQYDTVAKSRNARVVTYTSTRGLFLGMDNSRAPFDDPVVRRGLAQAIPYDDIIAFVHRNRALRWKSVVRLPFPGYTDEFWRYDTDPDAAAAALAPLIKARTPIALSYPVGAGAGAGAAILIQATLKSLGVDCRLDGLSPALYNQRRISGELAFFTDELDAPVVSDAHYELNQLYTSKAAQPRLVKFQQVSLIDPISAQLAALDPMKQLKRYSALLREAQGILVPLMPIIPISMTGTSVAVSNQLETKGLLAHQGGFVRFDELGLKR